uniref:Uncharacterized protein n=1 Tax=Picocystis salinarum TaxID=88271 RepID=A0A7S3UHZ8_9CHLO|mmetsp:Transcript_10333/g.63200  ORF Transcript_10333/g.63200 Transcript_10333/m.63200 type:complete len:540 (+) Transcript_10333:85-1704(+)
MYECMENNEVESERVRGQERDANGRETIGQAMDESVPVTRQAKEAFEKEEYQTSYLLYSEQADACPQDLVVRRNRCVVLLKLKRYEEAKQEIENVLTNLRQNGEKTSRESAAKTYVLNAACLLAMGQVLDAIKVLRSSLRETVQSPGEDVHQMHFPALCCAVGKLGRDWMGAYYADRITEAEKPATHSSRDGRALKMVPSSMRIQKDQLRRLVSMTLKGRLAEGRSFLLQSWGLQRRLGRHVLAMFRAYAYLQAGLHDQALKDANMALAYSPGDGHWARGHAVLGAALAANLEWQRSALHYRHAMELEPGFEEFESCAQESAEKLSMEEQRVLRTGGTKSYSKWLEEEKERNLPEFLKKRPKYYYYYEWMKKRIAEFYPVLPDPVLDKLLDLDADELDMLLQYPEAIQGQVTEFLDVYETKGAEFLATYRTPQLSWDEVKALQNKAALGIEGEEQLDVSLLEHLPEDTNHALLGAGGRGELTEAERSGLPVRPQLPPDAARDRMALEGSLQDRLKLLEHRAFDSSSTPPSSGADMDAMD